MSKCMVEGCNAPHFSRGYCEEHHELLKKHKKLPKINNNIYIPHDDYVELFLYAPKDNKTYIIQFDWEDYDFMISHTWSLCRGGKGDIYVRDSNSQRLLHRLLMGLSVEDKVVVDHIDRNPFNNRRSNLRICTHQQNMWNKGVSPNSKTGVKGVTFDGKKYRASITVKRLYIPLGKFDTLEEAKEARREAELKFYGEYSPFYQEVKNA